MRETAAYGCYLGLGANLGQREAVLDEALRQLAAVQEIEVRQVSSYYETDPWGVTQQPAFLNAAAEVWTTLEPLELLAVCQRIEQQLGRVRKEKWGPRTIDIDLLFAAGRSFDTPELRLPHPYLKQRAFVLVPLAEIAAEVIFDGHSFAWWRDACEDTGSVRKILPKGRDLLKKG